MSRLSPSNSWLIQPTTDSNQDLTVKYINQTAVTVAKLTPQFKVKERLPSLKYLVVQHFVSATIKVFLFLYFYIWYSQLSYRIFRIFL